MKKESERGAPADLRLVLILKMLIDLVDDERRQIFSYFCKHCGSKDPGCQCWNDD